MLEDKEFIKLQNDNQVLELSYKANKRLYKKYKQETCKKEYFRADQQIIKNLDRMADIWQRKRSMTMK